MINSEKISVIMPIYNASLFLMASIESVLHQTYENFELILIDDCSTDMSLDIIHKYEKQDRRIKVIILSENGGVANARNIGIKRASGSYIALIDSDDVWMESKLEKQLTLAQKTGAEIVYCSYDFIDETGRKIKSPYLVPERTDYKKMLSENMISCSTAFIQTELLKQHPFPHEFYHEDYVLWMQLLKNGKTAAGCPEVLMSYRQVKGSRSNDKKKSAAERWKIYRKALNMNLSESIKAFFSYALHGIRKYYF